MSVYFYCVPAAAKHGCRVGLLKNSRILRTNEEKECHCMFVCEENSRTLPFYLHYIVCAWADSRSFMCVQALALSHCESVFFFATTARLSVLFQPNRCMRLNGICFFIPDEWMRERQKKCSMSSIFHANILPLFIYNNMWYCLHSRATTAVRDLHRWTMLNSAPLFIIVSVHFFVLLWLTNRTWSDVIS